MDAGRNELIKIKEVLKANPKGLSLGDISRLVNMNRHSIAKYMEMLTISGQVEMRSFGPSKVYYLSQRVPISAMLGFSSDMICTLDRDMKIIQVNDAFLTFFGLDRENFPGQNIRELDNGFPVNNGMIKLINEALNGKPHQHNIRIQKESEIRYIKMKLIPTAFDDGTTGVVFIGEDITAEKQAEQALKASKVALEKKVRMTTAELDKSNSVIRAVLDSLPVGVIVLDAAAGRISYVSPGITRFYGTNLEGKVMDASLDGLIILKPDGQVVGDDKVPMIRALRNGDTIYNAEHILRLKDNKEICVLVNSTPVYGQDGRITAAVSTITDITERKLAEEALRESKERFKAIFDRAAMGIAISDRDGFMVDSNSAFQEMLGYSKEDLRQKRFYDITHPGDIGKNRELHEKLAAGSINKYQIVKRYFCKDGRTLWVKMTASAINDSEGRFKYNMAVAEDITERKMAENRLQEQQRFTSTLISNLPGMVYRCRNDLDWTMEYVSEGCRDLTGFAPEDLTNGNGISYNSIIHHEDRERVWREIQGALENSHPFKITYRIVTKSGQVKWVREQGRNVHTDSNGSIALEGFITDITDQKETEKRLIETTKFLQASLQASPLAVNAIDLNTNVILWNKMAEKVFGWTEEEVLGTPLPTLPDDKAEAEKLHAMVNSGKPLGGVRISRRKKDGTPIDLIIFSSPLHDENGRLYGALGVFYDVGIK